MRIVESDTLPPNTMLLVNEHAVADFLHRRFRGDPPPGPDELEEAFASAVAVDPQTYAVLMKGIG